ncbi:MAG: ROK family protein [Oliverpabstia sp.]
MIAAQLKIENRKKVFNYMRTKYLRLGEETSKAEISKNTGISAPTLMKIADFFLQQGILEEKEKIVVSLGRPSQMLKVKSDCMYALGFLLEGMYLYMGVVDVFGTVVFKKICKSQPDLSKVLTEIKDLLIPELLEEANLDVKKIVGIGLAMPVSYNIHTRCVSNGVLVKVTEERYIGDYLDELEKIYHVPVFFENDANAECMGVNRKLNMFTEGGDVLLLSVGTGIGAAMMLEGKLRRGYHERCGEIGATIINSQDEWKQENWLENQVSLVKLLRNYRVETAENEQESLASKNLMIEDVAKKIAILMHNANIMMDCKDMVVCGRSVEVMGEPFREKVETYLMSLTPFEEGAHLWLESPFAGVAGIADLCIENKIQEIMEL